MNNTYNTNTLDDVFPSQMSRHPIVLPTEDTDCPICLESLGEYDAYATLFAPCCRNGWFHRKCLAGYAKTSGVNFKCPLCNNRNLFGEKMAKMGICLFRRPAEWEGDPHMIFEYLRSQRTCIAPNCHAPMGRFGDDLFDPLLNCTLCGSKSMHRKCYGRGGQFECYDCKPCVDRMGRNYGSVMDVDDDASYTPMAAGSSSSGGHQSFNMSYNAITPPAPMMPRPLPPTAMMPRPLPPAVYNFAVLPEPVPFVPPAYPYGAPPMPAYSTPSPPILPPPPLPQTFRYPPYATTASQSSFVPDPFRSSLPVPRSEGRSIDIAVPPGADSFPVHINCTFVAPPLPGRCGCTRHQFELPPFNFNVSNLRGDSRVSFSASVNPLRQQQQIPTVVISDDEDLESSDEEAEGGASGEESEYEDDDDVIIQSDDDDVIIQSDDDDVIIQSDDDDVIIQSDDELHIPMPLRVYGPARGKRNGQ